MEWWKSDDDDKAACLAFYNEYARVVGILCERMLRLYPNYVEDETREALAKAWHARKTFRGDGTALSWVKQIAVRRCLDLIRRKKRERINPYVQVDHHDNEELADSVTAVDDRTPADHITRSSDLDYALSKLDDLSYNVITCQYLADMSVEDIATNLDLKPGDVYRISLSARTLMATCLKRENRIPRHE